MSGPDRSEPPPGDGRLADQLAYLGWPAARLRQMTADNPRAFLGMTPTEART